MLPRASSQRKPPITDAVLPAGAQAPDPAPSDAPARPAASRKPLIVRFWPLYLIAGALIAAWQLGAFALLSPEGLKDFYVAQQAWLAANPLAASAIYVLVYAAATLFMLPGALWLTIGGGLFFGLVVGSLLTVLGATAGATLLFLMARTSLGGSLRRIAGPWVDKVKDEFKASPISYMFAIRFIPVMPFPVANILPAILGARLLPYLLTTSLGIIPGVVAYSWVGAGLSATIAEGGEADLASAAANLVPAALALLAVSLVPVLLKKIRARRKAG